MAKPSVLPEWASSASAAITEPTLAQKQAGWSVRQRLPAQYLNWWKKTVYQWVQYLDGLTAEALTWTAKHTFNAGLATPAAPAAANDVVNKAYADGLVTSLKAAANTWSAKQTLAAGADVTGAIALVEAALQRIRKTGGKLQLGTGDASDLELMVGDAVRIAIQAAGGTQLTGTVARAPLNLAPQAAPTAPANGDVWVDAGDFTLKARLNGATQTVASQGFVAGLVSFRMSQWQSVMPFGNTLYNVIVGAPAGTQSLNFANQGGTYQFLVPADGWYRLHIYAQGTMLMEAGTNVVFGFGRNGAALSGVEAPAVTVYQASGGNPVYTATSLVSLAQNDILNMLAKFSNTTTGWSGIARFFAERVS
jgi:hypothetical protein